MLSRKNDALHASLFADTCPLTAVKVGGIEQLRVLVAETPLLIGVRVQGIVDEGVHLHILPFQLLPGGDGADRFHLRFATGQQEDGRRKDRQSLHIHRAGSMTR